MGKPKLTPSQVLTILRQRREQKRTLISIADEFGITPETVRLIEERRIWKKLLQDEGVYRGA